LRSPAIERKVTSILCGIAADLLDRRRCSRATLARQHLLERARRTPRDVVGALVGLQAQEPLNPYLALWSRLERFDPDELGRSVVDRELVRIVVMRSTIHLVTADDCLVLRPFARPVIDRELRARRDLAPGLAEIDLDPVLAFAHDAMTEHPRTPTALRALLAAQFPGLDPASLAAACRNHLPLVQVPPRGVWGRTGGVTYAPADTYLGRALVDPPPVDEIVLRYFAAFGPAAAADLGAWSGLTGARELVERVRVHLREFRDERGRAIFDLPDAPRPDADVPAPPRFLPEYDNVLLSHADRSRFLTDEDRRRLSAGRRAVRGSVVWDGAVVGTWRTESRDDGSITLVVDHLGVVAKRDQRAIVDEGLAAHAFLDPDAPVADVRFVRLD
jgi:hypothetical protein